MSAQADRMFLCWVFGAAFTLGCAADGTGDTDAVDDADAELDDVALDTERAMPQQPAPPATSCTQESDCAGSLACVAGTCQPCSAHSQCESDVCDQDAATGRGRGACIREASVIYVDARADRPACLTGDGSRANPVCEIRYAIPMVTGRRHAIRVYPGNYIQFSATDLTFSVFGPQDGSALVGWEDYGAGARITGTGAGARVVLDGLDFGNGVINGVVCQGASLKVVRSNARGDFYGITATDCDLEVDRVRASGSNSTGLRIDGTGSYRITNSYFGGGDRPSVVFGGSSTGIFQFNTVTTGGEIRPGGIDCGTVPRQIRDSIVVTGAPAAGGAQTVGACIHRRVVVGSGDTRPDVGLVKLAPDLDPQGRLLDTPASRACCIDKGARHAPGLYRDFFGTCRPQGASNDIGAHELPQ